MKELKREVLMRVKFQAKLQIAITLFDDVAVMMRIRSMGRREIAPSVLWAAGAPTSRRL
jgi:hypothetical protein